MNDTPLLILLEELNEKHRPADMAHLVVIFNLD
jgi:hypothetical protein